MLQGKFSSVPFPQPVLLCAQAVARAGPKEAVGGGEPGHFASSLHPQGLGCIIKLHLGLSGMNEVVHWSWCYCSRCSAPVLLLRHWAFSLQS